MVFAADARKDVDDELLTKTVTYRCFTETEEDLAYDTQDTTTYTDYSIKAQITINNYLKRFVQDGTLIEGNAVGLLRHEYDEEADGTEIDPVLVPKKGDRIYFLDEWYTIKDCTPATNEDDEIIGWDFGAARSG